MVEDNSRNQYEKKLWIFLIITSAFFSILYYPLKAAGSKALYYSQFASPLGRLSAQSVSKITYVIGTFLSAVIPYFMTIVIALVLIGAFRLKFSKAVIIWAIYALTVILNSVLTIEWSLYTEYPSLVISTLIQAIIVVAFSFLLLVLPVWFKKISFEPLRYVVCSLAFLIIKNLINILSSLVIVLFLGSGFSIKSIFSSTVLFYYLKSTVKSFVVILLVYFLFNFISYLKSNKAAKYSIEDNKS